MAVVVPAPEYPCTSAKQTAVPFAIAREMCLHLFIVPATTANQAARAHSISGCIGLPKGRGRVPLVPKCHSTQLLRPSHKERTAVPRNQLPSFFSWTSLKLCNESYFLLGELVFSSTALACCRYILGTVLTVFIVPLF